MAAPHRYRLYPNPAIAVLAIAEAPDGFLWLAAEDGLYRFDGFRYGKVPGFPFASARFIGATRDGAMWVAGPEGLACYKTRFEILLRESVTAMAVSPQYVLIKTASAQYRFHLDRPAELLRFGTRACFTVDPSGRVWVSSTNETRAVLLDPKQPETRIGEQRLPGVFEQVVGDAQGHLWAAREDVGVQVENGRVLQTFTRRHSQKTSRPYPLFSGIGGHLWFLGETLLRLDRHDEFREPAFAHESQPTAGYEDSRGHIWVAWLGKGLIEWIPDASWERWSSDEFQGQGAAQVVRTPQGHVILATRGNLYRLDASRDRWAPFAIKANDYAGVLPLAGGGFLACIRKLGFARLSPGGEIVEQPRVRAAPPDQYRAVQRDAHGGIWVGNKTSLLRLSGQTGSLHLEAVTLPGVAPGDFAQPVDFQSDSSGRLWVGYSEGLAWRDDQGRWRKAVTDQPIREVRSFALGKDRSPDEIWVAFRRAGRFSRLLKKGEQWRVTDFTPAGGYGPADTHFLRRDSRGWLWRGAPDGIHVSDGRRLGPNDWIHISPLNGLATETTGQYGFSEDGDGVWVAGEEGVSHLTPDPSWFDAPHSVPAPRVSRVELDGRELPLHGDRLNIPAGAASLRIDVGSLSAPPFRGYPLRYRLEPLFSNWRLSSNGSLEFHHLTAHSYKLELGFTGNGASRLSQLAVEIGSPPSRTTWLWLTPLPFAAGALALLGPWFPWSERNRYRVRKFAFVLRRRFSRPSTSGGVSDLSRDYSGMVFLNRYRVIRAISRGGFSLVYEGCDLLEPGARVAIKILAVPNSAGGWVRDRFAHEVAALRSVQHPAVVRVLDSWITPEGEPSLAMPLLEGPTLREVLRAGPLTPARVAAIVCELAAALAEMHARGIVHRDLKPENIMFTGAASLQPVIIDFGTAGLRARRDKLTTTTLLAGSFQYMAPERLTGHYSPASDLYSLGVIALEMLTGKRLSDFRCSIADPEFHQEVEQALLRVMARAQAAAAAAALMHVCEPQPQRRPADVRAWSAELASALGRT